MPKKPTGSKSAPTTSTRIDPATVPMTSSAVTAPPMETPAVAAAPAKKKTSIKSTAKSKASEPAPEVVEIAPEPVAVIDAAPVAVVEIAPIAARLHRSRSS